ncbi:MAG: Hsp70 family protein [Cyanobacteria bacterium P01_F01_bin.143]
MSVDNEFNPVLGIDLGTTFSAIARWDGRGPRTYQTKQGKDSLQSAIYYDAKNDDFLVGELAFRKGFLSPENLVVGIKRQMDDANHKTALGGKEFSPIELSSKILQRLYCDVQDKFPQGRFDSRGTVVTVPYYFKAHQCENTRQAAEDADINCIGILQEPIAASLSYAWQIVQDHPEQENQENILVFDLGGGTFDLTLFKLEQTQEKLLFEVLATGGDDRLGGMDFDECLVELLLKKSGLSLDGLTESEQRKARQKLIGAAIEAKITLSSTEETYVTISEVIPGEFIDTELTRSEFETSIEKYIDKIEGIIEKLWATANIDPTAIDRVILVGGSSKIPKMKSLLCDLIGEEKVYRNTNPALCVSEGAAMYAAYLDDREVFGREIEIRTRTCHALGVATVGGRFDKIIPANLKTPCERKKLFTTHLDNATSVNINVYQGSASLVKDNSLIGTINIPDLPQKSQDELDIWVTFKVSEEQTLSVIVEVDQKRHSGSFTFT